MSAGRRLPSDPRCVESCANRFSSRLDLKEGLLRDLRVTVSRAADDSNAYHAAIAAFNGSGQQRDRIPTALVPESVRVFRARTLQLDTASAASVVRQNARSPHKVECRMRQASSAYRSSHS